MESVYKVKIADESCISAWIELVNEVEENFPVLVIDDYIKVLEKNIIRKTAICVKVEEKIIGILLFSPNQHCISCMAVHPKYRRLGIASILIKEMLRLMPNHDISVTTFRDGDVKGIAPRALYEKFNFKPKELLMEFDYPVQRFVLERDTKEEK